MTTIKKLLLIFAILVTAGFLGYSTWHQWNDNQTTTLERMRPIAPVATFSHGGSISHIAYDPKNPELIATAGDGNFVNVWNRNKHDSPQLSLDVYKENDGTTFIVGLAFSPSDNWIATKTFWTLEIWDNTSGNKLNTIHIPAGELAISSDGNNIALNNVHLTLWDVKDPKNIKGRILLPPEMGWDPVSLEGLERIDPYLSRNINIIRHNIPIDYSNECASHRYKAIDFSHDGNWIAAAGEMLDENRNWRPHAKIWDLHKQQLIRIIEIEHRKTLDSKPNGMKKPSDTKPQSNDIRSIEFSHDNRFFGLAADNGLTIWSLPDWQIYHEVLDRRISDIAFSPDGNLFAVADVKGITLYDIETLTPIALLKGKGILAMVMTIEFSPDGNTLAGGGFDGVLRLWDVSELNED